MRDIYNVMPFEIETISLERIFIDKVFAAEFYYERNEYRDVAKHIYDLTVLLENEQIKTFLKDKKHVLKIIEYKRKEELNRKGGIPIDRQIVKFDYFRGLDSNKKFETAFDEMQRIYVFTKQDELSKENIFTAISQLREVMNIE
jgi:hypothetical protein